jgi:O-antigen ligase
MTSKLNFIIKILFLLIPVALVSGPFLPDLFISLMSIIYLIFIIKKKNFKIFNNYFTYLFIAFYCIIIISSFLSEFKNISLATSVTYVRFFIFSFCIYYIINIDKKIIFYLAIILISLFILLLIDSLVQFYYGQNLIGIKASNDGWLRISSFFGKELKLGSFTIRFLPILLATIPFLSLKKKNENLLILATLSITFVLIYVSGERTSFFLFLLLMLSISFILPKKYLLIIIILLPFLAFVLTKNNKNSFERLFIFTFEQIGFFNQKVDEDANKLNIFSIQHQNHYQTAFKMFKDSPFFGQGPKSFRYLCDNPKFNSGELSCSTHPHNTYMQILSETGIFGSFYLFILLIYFLKKYYEIFKLHLAGKLIDRTEFFLVITFFVSLYPFVPSGNFFNNWLSIIYYYPVGLYLYKMKTQK